MTANGIGHFPTSSVKTAEIRPFRPKFQEGTPCAGIQQVPSMYQKSADGVLMGQAFFEKSTPKTAVKLRNRQHFNKSVKRSQNQPKFAESAIVPKISTFARNASEISRFSQKAK